MHYSSNAYADYHAVDLHAKTAQASPATLVLMLVDGLLDELARTRAHMVARRHEAKARGIDKCVDILHGLSSALDLDHGGPLAEELARLYDFCAFRLHAAGIALDPAMMDDVSSVLGTLRVGWAGLEARHG